MKSDEATLQRALTRLDADEAEFAVKVGLAWTVAAAQKLQTQQVQVHAVTRSPGVVQGPTMKMQLNPVLTAGGQR